jgi:isocitrate lyase
VQTEVPVKLLEGWLAQWCQHYRLPFALRVKLGPYRAGSELLELALLGEADEKKANNVFGIIVDRSGRKILSVRDQNTLDKSLRQKRLMTLMHLFLVHRYKIDSVHYLSPSEDNHYQTAKMKTQGIFSEVNDEIGEIIVADVNRARIEELIAADGVALQKLIRKQV